MNIEQLKGQWTQLKGEAKSKWGELSDDDLTEIEGDADKLVGKIQEKYGKSKEDAEQEINEWLAA